MSSIHYFGIRHHGPGSSQQLVTALQQLQPKCILIEGPADCAELLPMLAANDMQPPVALLAYATEDPNCRLYYPFVDYSPEYQATLFAVQNGIEITFIDVPANIQLAKQLQDSQDRQSKIEGHIAQEPLASQELSTFTLDPLGELAKIAGYQDAEAWWNDLIEQNDHQSHSIFETVESAIKMLRDSFAPGDPALQADLVREAYMRLEIAKIQKKVNGSIAVVCGAWHVPALKEKHTSKSDRELIKTLPTKLSATKLRSTWIPWASARLSTVSGYGAGVSAPMWYQHLWDQKNNPNKIEHWLVHIADELRQADHVISPASIIAAKCLCQNLAAIRNRPTIGFEEVVESVVACLCFGEPAIWQQIEFNVLYGSDIGKIPADAPLIPLVEDLQTQQKKLRLKPETLAKKTTLDLRTPTGLGKSILLHRLNILDIPWGVNNDEGNYLGTFRERWTLEWQPEFAIKLIENLIYGNTIEQASSAKIIELMKAEKSLSKLAQSINLCLESQLEQAASTGIAILEKRAAHTDDYLDLVQTITPLIDICRYGTAREMSFEHIEVLIERLTIKTALLMPYACRDLNDNEAKRYHSAINNAHHALIITDWEQSVETQWWQALEGLIGNAEANLQIAGLATRLMYQAEKLSNDELEVLLNKMLSRAVTAIDAARYFDGFFSHAVDRLLFDDILLSAIDHWLLGLEEEYFIEFLPLFRRTFSELNSMERKRLIDKVLIDPEEETSDLVIDSKNAEDWSQQLTLISTLFNKG